MKDLAALTAHTGVEFGMFTKKGKRLIVRGDVNSLPSVGIERAKQLAREGYRWSGRTHPGTGGWSIAASDGDRDVLRTFGQKNSLIYNERAEMGMVKLED